MISCLVLNSKAQMVNHDGSTPALPDTTVRQMSFGFNALFLVPNSPFPSSQNLQVKYRVINHATRLTGYSNTISLNYGTIHQLPVSIHTTDSIMSEKFSNYYQNAAGISIGKDFYKKLEDDSKLELYFGIGLFYGGKTVTAGWDSIIYWKDTNGIYNLTNDKSHFFNQDYSNSYSSLGIGLVPDVGLIYNPHGKFSVGLEWSEPLYYQIFTGPNTYFYYHNEADFGTDINFSLNLIWNFDLKKE